MRSGRNSRNRNIAPERPPHTSLLVERRQSDEANQCMGMIRRPWWSESNGEIWPGLHPYSFSKDILGFLMTTESQYLDLTSNPKDGAFCSIVSPSLYWVLGPTQTTGWAPPAGLTNTSSSSNLVFTGGLPSRYWPAQPCLASVGYRVIWLLVDFDVIGQQKTFLNGGSVMDE